ncbi:type II toxin-antitoxin system RelE family toxin [Marinilactibacillus kalidii]|uniref:type II toxin-antitoxin system RelE family toxin n=1 Tax=Marinilactibacillus kalidii TaxID=2820274 RepID=UPI001ABE97BF|nr:type II toxin-antitoxin system RelE/ParE family toxin [Marinilactibacillus kalidii]
MTFKVRYEKEAQKALKKMDKFQAKIIINWIEKNLVDCENPFQHGKGLTADKSGIWRYRVGDYRILTDISNEEITILILKIGHRKDIYR